MPVPGFLSGSISRLENSRFTSWATRWIHICQSCITLLKITWSIDMVRNASRIISGTERHLAQNQIDVSRCTRPASGGCMREAGSCPDPDGCRGANEVHVFLQGHTRVDAVSIGSTPPFHGSLSCALRWSGRSNWGTESDPDFKYHNGNTNPRGYGKSTQTSLDSHERESFLAHPLWSLVGHIGITVDDVYTACERFEKLGVEFVKRPDAGTIKSPGESKEHDIFYKHFGVL